MDKKGAPEDETLRKVLSEVVKGYTLSEVGGEKVFIKHFGNEDQFILENHYRLTFDKAREKGLPTEKETLNLLIEQEVWSEKEEDEIDETQKYLNSLRDTKKNLIIPSQIEQINKDIEEAQKKLQKLKQKKESLVTSTCESYAKNKNNDFSLYLSFFKNESLSEKFFTEEEFGEIPKTSLQNMFLTYVESTQHLSIDNIKYLSISSIFSIYYNILGPKSLYKFFDRSIYLYSYYQLNLLNYTKVLNSILENVENIPEAIKGNPDDLLDFADSQKRTKSIQEKSKDKQGFSVVGATKKDMGEMGVSNEMDISPFELAKKKGSLTIEDFQNFS